MKKTMFLIVIVSLLALLLSIYSISLANKKVNQIKNKDEIEIKIKDGFLQWRNGLNDSWKSLIELSSLYGKDGSDGRDGINGANGKDGRYSEFRVYNNIIQWKYLDEDDTKWRDLLDISLYTNNSEATNSLINSVNNDSSKLGCFINNTICSAGTLVNINLNSKETMDFYVINDDGKYVDLIASKNIGNNEYNTVAWYSASSGNTTYGPITVLSIMNELTKNWTYIEALSNYYYSNSIGYKSIRVTSGNTIITDGNNNSIEVPGISKARLLTLEEANYLGCRTSTSTNCPDWLYSNLDREYNSLTPFGYWLSSAYNSSRVYNMRNTGLINNNATSDTTGRGIRPVIRIRK